MLKAIVLVTKLAALDKTESHILASNEMTKYTTIYKELEKNNKCMNAKLENIYFFDLKSRV